MTLKFGLVLPQGRRMDLAGMSNPIEAYETMTRVAQEAEALGFHSVWLFDHFHTVPTPTQEVTFECWTSTAALARDTRQVRIGQIVTCTSYRHPALLAKMASTVDVLSHGRLTVGIGAGWDVQEAQAYGYHFPDAPTRLRQLRDAIRILLAMWSQEEAVMEGTYYSVHGAINQPKGVQQPHIPLLIGGNGEQITLKLVAQYADACNIENLENEELERKFAMLKKHCDEVGRDYQSIQRTVFFNCAIAETDNEALAASGLFRRPIPPERLRQRALVGTPNAIRKRVQEIEQAGAQELILYLPASSQLESIHMFAEACMQRD